MRSRTPLGSGHWVPAPGMATRLLDLPPPHPIFRPSPVGRCCAGGLCPLRVVERLTAAVPPAFPLHLPKDEYKYPTPVTLHAAGGPVVTFPHHHERPVCLLLALVPPYLQDGHPFFPAVFLVAHYGGFDGGGVRRLHHLLPLELAHQ